MARQKKNKDLVHFVGPLYVHKSWARIFGINRRHQKGTPNGTSHS